LAVDGDGVRRPGCRDGDPGGWCFAAAQFQSFDVQAGVQFRALRADDDLHDAVQRLRAAPRRRYVAFGHDKAAKHLAAE
jgi:hypothetical protein